MYAGISGGLVRFSVGLTGSAEQRWGQLEEAWRNVAQVPASVKPAFRAHKVGTQAHRVPVCCNCAAALVQRISAGAGWGCEPRELATLCSMQLLCRSFAGCGGGIATPCLGS